MMGSRQWVEHERLETLPFQCRTKQVDITVLPLQLLVRFPLDLGKRFDTSVFFNTRSIADTLFLVRREPRAEAPPNAGYWLAFRRMRPR